MSDGETDAPQSSPGLKGVKGNSDFHVPLSSSAIKGESQEHPSPPMSQSHVDWAGQRAEKGQALEGFVVRNVNSSMAAQHGEMAKQTDAPSYTREPAKSHSKLGLAPEKADEEKLWIVIKSPPQAGWRLMRVFVLGVNSGWLPE